MKFQVKTVLGVAGQFYEGDIPRTICFVPATLVQAGRLDEGQYVLQGWASMNIKAQDSHLGVGSHLFPDLTKPVTKSEDCNRIKARLERLRPRAVSA